MTALVTILVGLIGTTTLASVMLYRNTNRMIDDDVDHAVAEGRDQPRPGLVDEAVSNLRICLGLAVVALACAIALVVVAALA